MNEEPTTEESPTEVEADQVDTEATDEDSSTGNRQVIGLILAIILGLAVVGGVLFVTLSAGNEPDAESTGTSAPQILTQADSPLIKAFEDAPDAPKGDYTAFCAEFAKMRSGLSPGLTIADLRTFYRDADFATLIAVAPPGVQPSLAVLRDDRDRVLVALEGIDNISELTPADLPEGYLQALVATTSALTKGCELS